MVPFEWSFSPCAREPALSFFPHFACALPGFFHFSLSFCLFFVLLLHLQQLYLLLSFFTICFVVLLCGNLEVAFSANFVAAGCPSISAIESIFIIFRVKIQETRLKVDHNKSVWWLYNPLTLEPTSLTVRKTIIGPRFTSERKRQMSKRPFQKGQWRLLRMMPFQGSVYISLLSLWNRRHHQRCPQTSL